MPCFPEDPDYEGHAIRLIGMHPFTFDQVLGAEIGDHHTLESNRIYLDSSLKGKELCNRNILKSELDKQTHIIYCTSNLFCKHPFSARCLKYCHSSNSRQSSKTTGLDDKHIQKSSKVNETNTWRVGSPKLRHAQVPQAWAAASLSDVLGTFVKRLGKWVGQNEIPEGWGPQGNSFLSLISRVSSSLVGPSKTYSSKGWKSISCSVEGE